MKRLSLLLALSLLLCGDYPAHADHKSKSTFRIGTKARTQGTVRFEVNGGAGRRPQFRIDGHDHGRFDKFRDVALHRVASGNSFPVAVGPYGYGGQGCYFGMGGFSNLYNQGYIPVPPYFSLHPPVYYSVPVPRTYGYSPFPYPGSVPTPEVVIREPETIMNPHVEPEEAPAPAQEAAAKTASAPLVIRNPFVEQDATVTLTAQRVE